MVLTSLGGYFLLILLALLAPSPIPIPLDGIILGLIAKGFNPFFVITFALIGDLIGTFLIFKIGGKTKEVLENYDKNKSKKSYKAAEKLFQKFGKYSLLLSGVPFLGDALIFISGFYKLDFYDFVIYFLSGKVIWYSVLGLTAIKIFQPFARQVRKGHFTLNHRSLYTFVVIILAIVVVILVSWFKKKRKK